MKSLIGIACLLTTTIATAADRYAALLTDGTRISDGEVQEWAEAAAQPKLAGRALFDPGNPLRWMIDRQQPPSSPVVMGVEFAGGDRFVGEVIGYRSGQENPFDQTPASLLVRPESEFHAPDEPNPAPVRVTLEWLQRIIWEPLHAGPLQPGTIFLRNGGERTFANLRWGDGSVTLLNDGGVLELSWSDIAEIHLPRLDTWTAYAQQSGVLAPGGTARLIQWDTSDGSRVTASTERFQPRHWGDKNRPEAWLQLVQPAWSLDPLWIRFRNVTGWRSFPVHEPPLSMAAPSSVRQESVFSGGWRWQSDRNTQQGRLQIGPLEFSSGFGVHATTDLSFNLPFEARDIRTTVGLDVAAGNGGCVSVAVRHGESQSLFERGPIVGSKDPIETGWLAIPPAADGSRRVTLSAEMVDKNRPTGADPFDIRDIVDWGDPTLRFDAAAWQSRVQSHSTSRPPALLGWTINKLDEATLRTANVLDNTDHRDPRFRVVLRSADRFVVFSRRLKVLPQHHWFALACTRFPEETKPSSVQIRIDGISAGEFDVPQRQGPIDPEPLLASLAGFQGKTVLVELILHTPEERSFVDIRGAALLSSRPGIKPLFEDEAAFATALNEEVGLRATLQSEAPFSGTAAVRLPAGRVQASTLPGLEAQIVDSPRLGQYRYLVFAWKTVDAPGLTLQLAHEGRFGAAIGEAAFGKNWNRGRRRGPLSRERSLEDRGLRYAYTYDCGSYRPLDTPPLRLDGNPPREWRLEDRDLYGDFGFLRLTGLGFSVLEPGTGLFDHIYLARTPADRDYVKTYLVPPKGPPAAPDPHIAQRATRPEEWGPAVAQFAPTFAITEAAHGLYQLREHRGQAGAWQSHPNDQQKPFVLRTGLHLPADRPQALDILVSHQTNHDFVLVVKANGQTLFEQLIDEKLTASQRGYANLHVSLASLAGQKVLLEVLNQSNNWSNEHAFWKRVALVDATP